MFGWSFGALLKALGEVAFKNVGKGVNDVASGDDTRIVSALNKNNNLSDLQDKFSSIKNIGGMVFRGNLYSTNLNTLGLPSATGLWYQPDSRNTDLGYPVNGVAGSLMVCTAGNTSTSHIFIVWNSGETWTRTWDGTKWSAWQRRLNSVNNLSELQSHWRALRNIGGVWFAGSLSNQNLNNLTGDTRGVYYQSVDANATRERNYPGTRAGVLKVMVNNADNIDGCTQQYFEYNTNRMFTRRYKASSKTWQPWVEYLFSVHNLSDVSDKAEARKNLEIYSAVYPIGSVIKFDNNANPNSAFPGTIWTEIKDGRIMRSSPNGSTGNLGSDSFTLTEANIPKHTHTVAGNVGANGNHTHWDGYNAPGNSPWDERLPNESSWDAAVRLTGKGYDTSGTDNQGQHDRRRTTVAGSHSHPISITCSEAYSGATQAVNFTMTSKYYRVWKRTA